MAYNARLADRVRLILAAEADLREQPMFGGVSFMVGGNFACGVHTEDLIVRVGVERHEQALAQPGARIMDFTGRHMRGWVMVAERALRSPRKLKEWVSEGVQYAKSLPAKPPTPRRRASSSSTRTRWPARWAAWPCSSSSPTSCSSRSARCWSG